MERRQLICAARGNGDISVSWISRAGSYIYGVLERTEHGYEQQVAAMLSVSGAAVTAAANTNKAPMHVVNLRTPGRQQGHALVEVENNYFQLER
jgi:hypothetical protein